jgi:hypothetical protein
MSKAKFGRMILAAVAGALLTLPALADSQARIVRLSDVHGTVQIDKNTGMGFENAFLNLPITQGTRIRTRDNGRAEVEFEDGSTLRLAANSLVAFDSLGLTDAGMRMSVVNLEQGMAYTNWFGKKGDQFTLNFAHEKIALDHAAHFRVQVAEDQSQVAVFKGDVAVDDGSGNVAISKNKMATFDGSDEKPKLAGITGNAFDDWDKQATSYHDEYAKNNSTPYGYGFSDMNYYGSFMNVSGYGMMWQPFFTGIGWDPFMDGAWSFYPGAGYMFISANPWGWMPYRYGSWMFVPSYGWMWQPGMWNSVAYMPRFSGTLPAAYHAPVAPVGTMSTVALGRGGAVLNRTMTSRLTPNSGGIGIARGSLDNLHHLNKQVAKSGFADVRPAPQFAASSSRAGFGGYGGGGRASAGPAGSGHASVAAPAVSSGHASSGGGAPAHR